MWGGWVAKGGGSWEEAVRWGVCCTCKGYSQEPAPKLGWAGVGTFLGSMSQKAATLARVGRVRALKNVFPSLPAPQMVNVGQCASTRRSKASTRWWKRVLRVVRADWEVTGTYLMEGAAVWVDQAELARQGPV